MDKAQLATVCQHVPSYIPEDKPVRVVCIDGLYTPCGGTHVGTVADIRMMAIRKIKGSDGIVRVSYDVAR
jgi:alanyl-tRNA synthetase